MLQCLCAEYAAKMDIVWEDLTIDVGDKHVVRRMSGTARAGRMIAVMGPEAYNYQVGHCVGAFLAFSCIFAWLCYDSSVLCQRVRPTRQPYHHPGHGVPPPNTHPLLTRRPCVP